jgi:hypothetical protein
MSKHTRMATEPGDRLTRRAAAVFLSERLARSVSPRTLATWPVPYVKDGRTTTYARADLLAAIEARLAGLPRQTGGSPRQASFR